MMIPLPSGGLPLFVSIGLFCSFVSAATAGIHRVGTDDDWFALLAGAHLQPGDEVELRAEIYSEARRLSLRHQGTAERPIIIRGAEGERAVIQRPDTTQNSLHLEGAQYLVLRDLEITGGASGIRISPHAGVQPCGITLERLHIHHIAGVAVTCNHTGGDCAQMVFRENHIHHTGGHGEAFYLGANEGEAIFHDSVVERNYIHHLVGDEVSQGDGIEIKLGSYGNRVSGNIVHDTNYPGIVVYGTQGRARNEVSGNLVWNSNDHGIQAAADTVISGNFIADVRGAGIYSREHQGAVPGNLTIRHNVVLARAPATALRIILTPGLEVAGSIEITDNALVALGGTPAVRIDNGTSVTFRDNSGTGAIEGIDAKLASPRAASLRSKLPCLKGHPAWENLDRLEVERRFSERF